MERGKFEIEVNDTGDISVNIELAGGTVWLSKYEISSQFRVFVPAVTANLRTIFKSKQLLETDVVKLHRFTHKNGENASIDLYNLDVIVALSFRMNGAICKKFRIWVQEKIKQPIDNITPNVPVISLTNVPGVSLTNEPGVSPTNVPQ